MRARIKRPRLTHHLSCLCVVCGLLLVASPSCFALLVEDPTEWGKTAAIVQQLQQQYDTLQEQYQTMQDSNGQLKQQVSAITGNYGWGNWNNSASQLQQLREWAPSSWQDALQGMSGGNPERYQQLLSEYQQDHATMSTQSYAQGADTNLANAYQNEVQTNEASATSSSYEFNDINHHLQTLYQLGQQIENAQQNNNMKSAVDLNTRTQLEEGYISVEELRMQTVLNQQMAELQSANIASENEGSQYNQAGENP
jgi:type IV secretion system protein VirB5